MELAKRGGARRRAAKKAAETKAGGKRYVTPLPKKKVTAKKVTAKKKVTPKKPEMKGPEFYRRKQTPAPKKVAPKRKIPAGARSFRGAAATTTRPTRTPAQRAADKKKLLAEQKTLRKKSAGMRYGSEFKIPELGKKEQDAMARAMESGSGGGLIKAGVGAALTAAALKMHKMYKAKKAADLAAATAKAKRAAAAAKKAAEAKKGVSGIGAARAESALARTSGLGKAKPKPKPKAKKKKKSKAQIKEESMRGASAWR